MFFEIFGFPFFQNALVAGSAIGLCCAFLGVFLVARKSALIGDGLSHLALGAVSLGLFLSINPYFVSVPAVVLASIFIGLNKSKVAGPDSIIGILSSFGLALGVILSSKSFGQNASFNNYLFGSILSVSRFEVFFSLAVFLLTTILIYTFLKQFFAITFQEEYAKTLGIKTKTFDIIFFALVGLVAILAVRLAGAMLASALLILPAVSGLKLAHNFSSSFAWAGFLSLVAINVGLIISFIFDLPAGATIIMVNLTIFLIINKIKK